MSDGVRRCGLLHFGLEAPAGALGEESTAGLARLLSHPEREIQALALDRSNSRRPPSVAVGARGQA